MSVVFDAATENVQAADPQNFTHTPSGTPRGVLVFIAHATTASDIVSGVTYGGVTMSRVAFGDDASGEAGAGYLYFLGASIPTGAQTVSINRTEGTTSVWACAVTVTAAADTEVVDSDNSQQGDTNIANPSVTLQHGGRDCLDFFGGYNGVNAPSSITDAAGQTRMHDHDFGSQSAVASRKNASSTSDTTLSYTIAANSLAMIGVAIAEVATSDRRAQVTWAEMEVPNAPRRAIVSFAEMEVPNAPRRAIVSWAEMEVPTAPRRAIITFAEMEVPDSPSGDRRAVVTWAEMEVPDGARRAVVTWAEMELPNAPRRAIITWAELEVPGQPRRAIVTWAELEVPNAPDPNRRAIVTWAVLEVPDVPGQTVWLNWAWLRKPESTPHAELIRVLNRKLHELDSVIEQLHNEADALEARIAALEP